MIYGPIRTESGAVLQSGVPKSFGSIGRTRANGLLLRGVVLTTYTIDDPAHPEANLENPIAVYCDCVVVSNIPGSRWMFIPRVMVSQENGGIHEGKVWKPRASSLDVTGSAIDANQATDPANLNGDNVLIGFLNDSLTEPVILRGLPHPKADNGQEDSGSVEAGHRMKLKIADGNPDFWKHRGAFYGISNDGDFVVDLTKSYATEIDDEGKQPTPPGDGSTGNYKVKIPTASKLTVEIDGGDSMELDLKDGDAKITIGNGAVSVAIGDNLQTFYTAGVQAKYATHKHPTGTGPSGIPDTLLDNYNTNINSSKAKIPNG